LTSIEKVVKAIEKCAPGITKGVKMRSLIPFL
jgi:septation ring formation regulator EzrA